MKGYRTNVHNRQRGMTLAEVLVATAVFAVVVIAALMIYDRSNRIFKTSVESADLQQNTRVGFNKLVSDVRMMGFDYDRDGMPVRAASNVWQPLTNYAVGVVVSPTVDNGYSYKVVTEGKSGGLEPAPWPTTPGNTVPGDGTVTWMTLGPVFQQPDEQIEFAGRSAVTIRANFDYHTDISREHGRENTPGNNYEPAAGQFPIVTTANDEIVTYALKSDSGPNTDTIRFYADVARPRRAYPGGQAETQVSIPNVNLCTSGCVNPPYTLYRFTLDSSGNPTSGTPIATNVRDLQFRYYNDLSGTTLVTAADGTALANGAVGGLGQYDPANIGGTTNWADRTQRSTIQSVAVQLTGMSSAPDNNYTNPNETVAAVRKYRSWTLQSLVAPRNIGLSGMPEPLASAPGDPRITSVCVGSCNVVRVRWNPPPAGGDVRNYEVRYNTSGAAPFNNVGVVVPGDVLSAPVFNLNPGTTYYFNITAVNEFGSSYDPTAIIRGTPVNSTKPSPVADLAATDGAAAQSNMVTLTWTAPATNDASLANVSCIGTTMSGAELDPAEPIRYRIWRGSTPNFDPATAGDVVLDNTVAIQPTGAPGTPVSWVDDVTNARAKAPANCKDYYYRIQVYDTCALQADGVNSPPINPTDVAAANNPNNQATGTSTLFPPVGTAAIHGYATSTTTPAAPGQPVVDYSSGNSQCNRGANTCDVKIMWPPVTSDMSNPTQTITVDEYKIFRERKKAADTVWGNGEYLPIFENASDPSNMQSGQVVYHDTTALDHDNQDRRKWYYRYTIKAQQCGNESTFSPPVQFPQNCNLVNSTVIQSGASSGDGSPQSPWVMNAGDYIEVINPAGVNLNRVEFETYPEPDPNPNNPPLDRRNVNSPPFQYYWSNQQDGQVYRVVITMTNDQGCTEQAERFIQDDPINCPSATVTQTGASQGSGALASPWLMNAGDMITVNQQAGSPISSVAFSLFTSPGGTAVGSTVTDATTPFQFSWATQTPNAVYRLAIAVTYADGCVEAQERFIQDEPAPVCVGATAVATGSVSGDGLAQGTPWVMNGGDIITIVPPTGGNINQVVFTVTPVSPAGAALPNVSDSTSPFAYTWVDQTDNTIYRITALITYSSGCTETVTRYVKDQVCSGATVAQTGSVGAGTGMTQASPWIFNAGDKITVTPPTGVTITDVRFDLYREPGATFDSTSTDNATPYELTWTDRIANQIYRVAMTVTYTAGCTETITRYVKQQSLCFISVATPPTITHADSGSDRVATITFLVTNPQTEILTVKGIKVDWLRDAGHPVAVLESIVFTQGATTNTLSVPSGNQAPPSTTTLATAATPPMPSVPASSSTYTIAVKFNIGRKSGPTAVSDLTQSWISSMCVQYSAPSFGAGVTASCNVLGSTTNNPSTCN